MGKFQKKIDYSEILHPTDLAYIAGVIDSKAYITFDRHRENQPILIIKVKDLMLAEHISKLLNAPITKPDYRILVRNGNCKRLLELLKPLMHGSKILEAKPYQVAKIPQIA